MKLAVILEIYITKAVVITNDSPQNWEMGLIQYIVVVGLLEQCKVSCLMLHLQIL